LPDLTDEQYLAPVGQKNPRADLVVPSMKLVIEVKFQRAGDVPQKIVDEIASDASLYLVKDSPYRGIVCFIWDDGARTGDHDYLAAGLKKIHGVVDVVIVPRPGNMNREHP
jgi:REase_DpnII-MboI